MTPWEIELVTTVAGYVNALSLVQVSRTWWRGQRQATRQARQSVRRLVEGRWLQVHQAYARPVVELTEPLVEWRSGLDSPSFGTVSRNLHERSTSTIVGVTTVVTATQRSRELFGQGGAPRRLRLTQLTHELHVAEVFLAYRRRGIDPCRWLPEDCLPSDWPLRQRPDALLLKDDGSPLLAVEYGGDYSDTRLRSLHNSLSAIPLSYEIW